MNTNEDLGRLTTPLDGHNHKVLDIITLARTIWGEARGEQMAGMEAVGCVMFNRLLDPRWPNQFHAICTQEWQFSCWNDDSNRTKLERLGFDDPDFRDAFVVASRVVLWGPKRDTSNQANHYMTTELFWSDYRPGWADKMDVRAVIGRHTFLKG